MTKEERDEVMAIKMAIEGQTFTSVSIIDDQLIMRLVRDDGRTFEFYHKQDCCESVYVADVCGDMDDLVGVPIVSVNVDATWKEMGPTDDIELWTFYTFRTHKGTVTVRWTGASNGCYAVNVSFRELSNKR